MSPKQKWRLLSYAEHDGATNMAIDEAILEAHLQGLVPPTLRFYNFVPAAISLGLNQEIPEGLLARAEAKGMEVVRRPTGGRAVLHTHDLTYSFVGSTSEHDGFLSSSVSGAYKQICRGLQQGFQHLGVDLQLGSADSSYRKHHDCFGVTTGSDLHCAGKKLVGSAQLRRRHAVLQHGSILLNQDQAAMSELLQQDKIDSDRHANLFALLGKALTIAEMQAAIVSGFAAEFDIEFVDESLSESELKQADVLRQAYVVSAPAVAQV